MTKGTIAKLRIGFVLDDGLDKPDGVQQYVLSLGKWFQNKGHEVRYLVGQSKRRDIPELLQLSKNLKVSFNGNSLSVPIYSNGRKIKAVLKEENFDILHIQVPFSPVMGARVISKAPAKTAIVGTFHILPLNDSFFYRLGNKATATSTKGALKKIDKYFAVSKPAQEFARATYGINSDILPNPIELPSKAVIKKNFESKDKLTIVFLGRLVPRKGCLTLLQAIDALDRHYKDKLHVKIGGTGVEKKPLERYVRAKSLEHTVKFYGFIEEADKDKFLKDADMAIFPSKGGESFGIVLTEAMAAAGPIVLAGDNPGYRSVLDDKEVLFNPEDHQALSEKITHFIDDRMAMNRIFLSQQKLVKKFDINKIGESLLVNFRSIVQNKSK